MLQDIKISAGELSVDQYGLPELYTSVDVINQDAKHRIYESGLLERLVAERQSSSRSFVLQEIILLVESDLRVMPGTVEIIVNNDNSLTIAGFADSEKFNFKVK